MRVSAWWCPLLRTASEIAVLEKSLSDAELERAARFGRPDLRARYVVGRATLRHILGERLGVAPAEVRLRRGRRGRPEVDAPDGPDFNVSHTGGVALIALSDRPGVRIGVDLERRDRQLAHDRLAQKFLTEAERNAIAHLDEDARRQAFLRLWTCKEAMSKATGDALSAPFRHLDVETTPALRLRAGPQPYEPGRWELMAIEVPPHCHATLAIWRTG